MSVRIPIRRNFSPSDRIAALAPGGTAISAEFQLGAMRGTLAGGNGVFGEGDTCLFSGEVRSTG